MKRPHVYWDFQGTDALSRAQLWGGWAEQSIARQNLVLSEGMQLTLFEIDPDEQGSMEVMLIDAIATFDNEVKRWVSITDKSTFRRVPLKSMQWVSALIGPESGNAAQSQARR